MKRIPILIIIGLLLTGCSSAKDINYVADKYEAEVATGWIDNMEVYNIDKNKTVMIEDPNTKEKTELSNAVVIKTIYDYNAALDWMNGCYISFVSEKGKDVRGVEQHIFNNGEYTYLVYNKDNIEDIEKEVKYIIIEDVEADKNYVLEVPNQEGIMIYLK